MAESLLLPEAFGSSWATFVRKWCLGTTPVRAPAECARGLQALTKHWPEHVQTLTVQPARGLAVVLGAIDLGLVLADTANLGGFAPIFARLRAGERSAHSELAAAAAFARLGFSVALEVAVAAKVPDMAVKLGSSLVYAEVICPDRAEIVKAATDRIDEIAEAVLAAGPGGAVEVFLDSDPDGVDVAALCKVIRNSAFLGQPEDIPSVGRFNRVRQLPQLARGHPANSWGFSRVFRAFWRLGKQGSVLAP